MIEKLSSSIHQEEEEEIEEEEDEREDNNEEIGEDQEGMREISSYQSSSHDTRSNIREGKRWWMRWLKKGLLASIHLLFLIQKVIFDF